ncbi:MAG: hypothetical protein Q7S58_00055 [Candidatus Binatus sp.]|uniref:hypothetical protein n=1 Tax=Candidatus Binatus sp. TaxID=2811406 RepID=UPI0027281898|nr:hypothetical protein [Candidatus Binatus sp.]MDO8430778.1 hypothetical protein [Candidatus Binatus sp.]
MKPVAIWTAAVVTSPGKRPSNRALSAIAKLFSRYGRLRFSTGFSTTRSPIVAAAISNAIA